VRRIKTWQLECLCVAVVLFAVALGSEHPTREALCALAVLLEFGEATVVDRVLESPNARRPGVGKLLPYLVIRECVWIVYFLLVGSHSAIVGCVIFILYPAWRAFHRRVRDSKEAK